MPPPNNTIASPPQARKRKLPNKENIMTGNKYIAQNAKEFPALNPPYRSHKHQPKTDMNCSPRKPPPQTKQKIPSYLKYINLRGFSYMV